MLLLLCKSSQYGINKSILLLLLFTMFLPKASWDLALCLQPPAETELRGSKVTAFRGWFFTQTVWKSERGKAVMDGLVNRVTHGRKCYSRQEVVGKCEPGKSSWSSATPWGIAVWFFFTRFLSSPGTLPLLFSIKSSFHCRHFLCSCCCCTDCLHAILLFTLPLTHLRPLSANTATLGLILILFSIRDI